MKRIMFGAVTGLLLGLCVFTVHPYVVVESPE
jgi:hypothetical protein